MASPPFIAYASRIRALRRAHPDISEPALAPTFQRLLEELLPTLLVPQGMETPNSRIAASADRTSR